LQLQVVGTEPTQDRPFWAVFRWDQTMCV
jgi:hypothetical protein